jgi:hypothetical protein
MFTWRFSDVVCTSTITNLFNKRGETMINSNGQTEVKADRNKRMKLKKFVLVLFFLVIIFGVTSCTVKVVSDIKSMYNEINFEHDGYWGPGD